MISELLGLIKGSPAESSLILVAFSVFIAILLRNRKVNLEGIASVGKADNQQGRISMSFVPFLQIRILKFMKSSEIFQQLMGC